MAINIQKLINAINAKNITVPQDTAALTEPVGEAADVFVGGIAITEYDLDTIPAGTTVTYDNSRWLATDFTANPSGNTSGDDILLGAWSGTETAPVVIDFNNSYIEMKNIQYISNVKIAFSILRGANNVTIKNLNLKIKGTSATWTGIHASDVYGNANATVTFENCKFDLSEWVKGSSPPAYPNSYVYLNGQSLVFDADCIVIKSPSHGNVFAPYTNVGSVTSNATVYTSTDAEAIALLPLSNQLTGANLSVVADAAILNKLIPNINSAYDIYALVDSSADLPGISLSNHGTLAYTSISDKFYVSNAARNSWEELNIVTYPETRNGINPIFNAASNYGYAAQAYSPTFSTNYLPAINRNGVDKFAVVNAGTPVTSVGTLTVAGDRSEMNALSDTVGGFGFLAGGMREISGNPAANKLLIDKWPVTSEGSAVDLGDLLNYALNTGHSRTWSDNGNGYGYVYGWTAGIPTPPPPQPTYIDKFPFVATTAVANVGTFGSHQQDNAVSLSGNVDGYLIGGDDYLGTVSKYSFASNPGSTLAIQPFTLTQKRIQAGKNGVINLISGYQIGGRYGPATSNQTNTVSYFGLASGTSAVKTQTLTTAVRFSEGISGNTYGYAMGGYSGPFASTGNIEAFPYSSDDTPFVTVGSLTAGGTNGTGTSGFGN